MELGQVESLSKVRRLRIVRYNWGW